MQKGGSCLLKHTMEGWPWVSLHLTNLISTCQLHVVTALDFLQVIHQHLPLKPVFHTLILLVPECSSSSLYHSLLFPSFFLGVFFQLLSIPECTSFCFSAEKQRSQNRAFFRVFLHQKSFECSLAIEIKSKGRFPGCSNAPVLFLLMLKQVSFKILQHTQPQIITDKLGKCTLG